ncbi:MAG: CDP-diacylglycerol--glycerol-3-phosphate 3-phosphatidyltransferase [Acidobacteria bacterium]|nr:MAG: CDP-diacylglycerol--glycerol-3-phosphate 3-phosphatidyltransferase [Acidobacteriota bacterium]
MSSRIITLPNVLTVFRMALIPVFVSLLFYQQFLLALAVFVVAGITDGLDGLLARRFHQQSPLGRILDPIADKMMLVTSFVVLSMRGVYPVPMPKHLPIPFWVTITVISRDVFILVGAAAINMVTGFRAFQPSLPGKISTVVQIASVAVVMLAAQTRVGTGYYLPSVYAAVFALTLVSGIHYIFFVSRLLTKSGANSSS